MAGRLDREALVPYLRELVEVQKMSMRQASAHLQEIWPHETGLGKDNIIDICKEYGITGKVPAPDETVEHYVDHFVAIVGPTYGQRMMKSLFESVGLGGVAKYRIADAMKRLYPDHHEQRCTGGGQKLNPQTFDSEYFGQTLHMDQNEKMQMYGVCIVQAVDGHSSYVTGFAVMPIKNNLTIYEKVFRHSVLEFGVWEQLIVDKGREFYLCEFMQLHLRMKAHEYHLEHGSRSVTRMAYRQVPSVRNTRSERLWVEVNKKIQYTYKAGMVDLVERAVVDPSEAHDLFSISQVLIPLVEFSLKLWVNSWNSHYITGRRGRNRGRPESHVDARRNLPVFVPHILSTEAAVAYYERSAEDEGRQARLTDPRVAGADRLEGHRALQECRDQRYKRELGESVGSIQEIGGRIQNGDFRPLEEAILLHKQITLEIAGEIGD